MRFEMKNALLLTTGFALTATFIVLALGIGVASATTPSQPRVIALATARPTPPPPRTTQASRQEVEAQVRRITAIVRRSDRFESKQSTWGELQNAQAAVGMLAGRLGAGPSADRPIWVIAVAGEIRHEFDRPALGQLAPKTYPWGVFVYDINGNPLASYAGNGPWPPYFAPLLDRAGP
jgi:hypothetical protein